MNFRSLMFGGGGGGATHRSWVVKSGAVASHYGRRPSCLLSPNRECLGSGWSSLWQHRPCPPTQDQNWHRLDASDRHPRRTRVWSARPHRHSSTLRAALLYHLTGPTAIHPHLLREGLSKDRGKRASRAGDWVLSPNGPLGKVQCPGYHYARFPEDHSCRY